MTNIALLPAGKGALFNRESEEMNFMGNQRKPKLKRIKNKLNVSPPKESAKRKPAKKVSTGSKAIAICTAIAAIAGWAGWKYIFPEKDSKPSSPGSPSSIQGAVSKGPILQNSGGNSGNVIQGGNSGVNVSGGNSGTMIQGDGNNLTVNNGFNAFDVPWQPPELPDTIKTVTVELGEMKVDYSVDKLKTGRFPFLGVQPSVVGLLFTHYLTTNTLIPIFSSIVSNRLFVDVTVPCKDTRLMIHANSIKQELPPDWDSNDNGTAIEIVSEKRQAICRMVYERPERVRIEGVFVLTNGHYIAFFGKSIYQVTNLADIKLEHQRQLFKYPSGLYHGQLSEYNSANDTELNTSALFMVPDEIIPANDLKRCVVHVLEDGSSRCFLKLAAAPIRDTCKPFVLSPKFHPFLVPRMGISKNILMIQLPKEVDLHDASFKVEYLKDDLTTNIIQNIVAADKTILADGGYMDVPESK